MADFDMIGTTGFDAIRSMNATERPREIFEFLDKVLLQDNENLSWIHDLIDNSIAVVDHRISERICQVFIEDNDTWGDIEKRVKQQVQSHGNSK